MPYTARTSLGKRVGGALYVHVAALDALPSRERIAANEALAITGADADGHNAVKIEREARKISFLTYAEFFNDPFPQLVRAVSVDLGSLAVTAREYDSANNPPILHRKELLLPVGHPCRPRFAALTQQLEAHGLFRDSSRIGRRKTWQSRLKAAGVRVEDHELLEEARAVREQPSAPPVAGTASEVQRHKTAISRSNLSRPMQALARHGFLDGDRSVFDYGCGRGDDVTVLTAAGITARGWDPHYAPASPLEEADVVNLGFVLNVIEDPEAREDALRRAYGLAGQVLAVAVVIAGRADVSGLVPYRDGFLTARRTFQKYFTQEEARDLISRVTGQEAIPVAPGVFLAFSDKIEEQRFLDRRSRRRRDISHPLAITPSRASGRDSRNVLIEEHRDLLDAVWSRALELGRVPHPDELIEDVADRVRTHIGSLRRTIKLAQSIADPAGLTRAHEARIADLTVCFADNLFVGRQKYSYLPKELQRDVKTFFSTYAQAEAAGRQLLFSVSNPQQILDGCRQACSQGIGHMFGEHSLQLHASQAIDLPPILRVYVKCAEKLFGSIDEDTADLLKIHIDSGKLTLLRYDDFFGKALPTLTERVKIRLREQDTDFFGYAGKKAAPRLTMKSRYMPTNAKDYAAQHEFDRQLAELEVCDFSGYGPDAATLARGLSQAGYRVAGFDLVPKS